MTDHTKRLEDIMATEKQKQEQQRLNEAAERRAKEEARIRADRFSSLFDEKRLQTIFPTLDKFARQLREGGHTATLRDEPHPAGAFLKLTLKPKDRSQSGEITVSCFGFKERVAIHDSTVKRTPNGDADLTEYTLDQVTAELVEKLAMDCIERTFQR